MPLEWRFRKTKYYLEKVLLDPIFLILKCDFFTHFGSCFLKLHDVVKFQETRSKVSEKVTFQSILFIIIIIIAISPPSISPIIVLCLPVSLPTVLSRHLLSFSPIFPIFTPFSSSPFLSHLRYLSCLPPL